MDTTQTKLTQSLDLTNVRRLLGKKLRDVTALLDHAEETRLVSDAVRKLLLTQEALIDAKQILLDRQCY